MGSKRHVDGLEDKIMEVRRQISTGEKTSKCRSDFTSTSMIPVSEDTLVPAGGTEVSNVKNFTVKEAHKIIDTEIYRNTWFDRAMTLCHCG